MTKTMNKAEGWLGCVDNEGCIRREDEGEVDSWVEIQSYHHEEEQGGGWTVEIDAYHKGGGQREVDKIMQNTFIILDLGLHIVDGIRGLNFEQANDDEDGWKTWWRIRD